MSNSITSSPTYSYGTSRRALFGVPLLAAGFLASSTVGADQKSLSGSLPVLPMGGIADIRPAVPVLPLIVANQKFTLNEEFCDLTVHPVLAPSGGIEFAGPDAGRPGNGEIRGWTPATGRPLVAYPLSNYPDANCNDGSPARLYVRAAPAVYLGQPNPHINKWQVHLKGGGSCSNWRDCAERWCDAPEVDPVTGALTPSLLNNPGLMSSSGMPEWAASHGIFLDNPLNRFSAYNQVLVAYCSSDSWMGNHDSTEITSPDPSDDGKRAAIQFRGKPIVKAVFDVLSQPGGLNFSSLNTKWDKRVQIDLPSLRDAQQLLVTGDSAGANGVRSHIDRIRHDLHALATPNKPLVIGALDAGGAPKLDDPLIDWSALPSFGSYTDFMQARFDQAVDFHGVTTDAVDSSCTSFNGFGPLCIDTTFVAQNHITTDLFNRTSLRDVLAKRALVNSGMLPNQPTLRSLTQNGLADLTTAGTEARRPISVIGPDSTQHVTFRGRPFYTLTTATGLSASRHLRNWVNHCEIGSCNSGAGIINDVD